MNNYCNNSWKTIVAMLKSDISKGLSENDCIQRKKAFGNNKVFVPYGNGKLGFIKEFIHLHIFISILISCYLIYSREIVMAIISVGLLLAGILIKVLHGKNKQDNIKFLQRLNNTTTTVLRDGLEIIVKSEQVLKGDIVIFSKGSLIPADIRIIRAIDIKVDEKNVTGENFLKDKFESKMDRDNYLVEEMKNILFRGSIIKEGEGSGIVVETGNSTQLGKMLAMLMYANNNKHTLGKKLEGKLGIMIFIISAFSIGMFLVTKGYGQAYYSLKLSLFATQSIPIVSIAFLYGYILKKDMRKQGIDLINFSTLDLISQIQVLFIDKIGAITKEEMIVNKIFVNNNIFEAKNINFNKEINIIRLIEIIVLCNNAIYSPEKGTGKGDLIEVAYLKFGDEKLAHKTMLESRYRRVFEIPMDSDKGVLTTLNKGKRGCRANVKGRLDAVLSRCTYIMIDGLEKEITLEDIDKIKSIDFKFSLEGLITQGVAYRSFSYNPTKSENIESNLVFVGIVALENPLSENIEEEIEEIKSRGIIPIIFTDDNKITATSIGKKTRVALRDNKVITGVEVDALSSEELIETVSRTRIFSRANPETKAKIIGLFTKDNYPVAACGETLGDLSVMSLCRLGIGKGNASEIIKKAADVFIQRNYLRGFLSLFHISERFNRGVRKIETLMGVLLFAEIIIINAISIISKGNIINVIPLIIINAILAVPLFIVLLKFPGIAGKNNLVIRSLMFIVLSLSGLYDINMENEVVLVLILGGMMMIYTIANSKISIRNSSLLIIIIGVLLWIGSIGILGYLNNESFSIDVIIKIGIGLIIYLIIELIMKKWQK
ncbi:cation-transporting P-type ATPase [Clostridium vincentii]|uniref:Calcium-transporting ATPase 1 n=1 Tax=Clostridium vincentii TaxID=52704 RepID=A0A2T0BJH3_9CLOT|nr:cation-transporting P-type ATPase [Clostridium vincentii]PRR83942.1 Calcium-transporting ATPase 1 [Clostridium vincentii]